MYKQPTRTDETTTPGWRDNRTPREQDEGRKINREREGGRRGRVQANTSYSVHYKKPTKRDRAATPSFFAQTRPPYYRQSLRTVHRGEAVLYTSSIIG